MERLREYAKEYALDLSDRMLEQFSHYLEMLEQWNKKCNLTAITQPEAVIVKHFLDSLLLLQALRVPENASIIDVGAGAGFPGLPVKIARPDIRLTLLDSLQKRVYFLEAVSDALGLDVECIHGRAEAFGRDPDRRERYDLATARAVATLPALCEYCLPFVRVGGSFAALKGPDAEGELSRAEHAMAALGAGEAVQRSFRLPGELERRVIVIHKLSQTPTIYPRTSVKIAKKPL